MALNANGLLQHQKGKWMCASYLKHTSLSNPTSSLGVIKHIIPSTPENTARGESTVIINENIDHYEETKFAMKGIQATAVRIKARNYPMFVAGIYCPPNTH
jgi:hypothetical protein